MLITEFVEIKWNNKNKKHFIELGYSYTNNGDSFEVRVEHLSKGSHAIVECSCDICGVSLFREYRDYLKKSKNGTDICTCQKCKFTKTKQTNLKKYGVEHVINNPEVRKKIEATTLKNYGVKNPFSSQIIIDKIKKFNIENYGVEYYTQTEQYAKQAQSTNLERYGVKYVTQYEPFREKMLKTMYKNGTIATSSQQTKIHSLTGGELNYSFGKSSLDIAFVAEKIYLEYDGGGHDLQVKFGNITQDEFDKKEQRRSFFLKDNGWREIRIISDNDKLPSDKTILDFVEIAKSFIIADKWFSAHWNIDEGFVKVNYKHTYSLDEFFEKFNIKEAFP